VSRIRAIGGCHAVKAKANVEARPTRVYIARDRLTGWFKIGMTGYDLEYYRKQLCYRTYGRRSHQTIEFCCSWLFYDFWSAWYVEQTTISLVERLELERVRSGDWFKIDRPTMAIVVDLIDDLALEIRKWERTNFAAAMTCLPLRHGPSR
jgi:hypothetical protein